MCFFIMLLLQIALAAAIASAPVDSQAKPRAIEHSDAYYTRLTIHRYGSYAMLPLFATEYVLGDRLLNGGTRPGWLLPTHVGVASGIGVLFTVNTVTGLWNLWDSRQDTNGRGLRILHSTLMLASEAGFALAAAVADDDGTDRTLHRNIALGSMGLSTLGTAIMWLRRD